MLEIIALLEQLGTVAPEIIAGLKAAWATVTATSAPTAEQQAAIDAALDAAHAALQAG